MGRIYTAAINAVSIAEAAEIFFIEAPGTAGVGAIIEIHEFKLTQITSVTSKQLSVRGYRTATDQGAIGTALTAMPHAVGDGAAGHTVQSAILTGTGTGFATPGTVFYSDVQNALNGFHYLPLPEDRVVISPGDYAVFKLETAPTEAWLFSGSVTFEEIGG